MASIAAPRVQHIGALADVTNNLPRVKHTGKDRRVRFVPTTRITSPSTIKKPKKTKYMPTMEEENYRKILSAPDPTALLNVDNGSIASNDSNPPPSPNMSKRRDKSGSSSCSVTPTTPPVAQFGGEQLVSIDEYGVTAVLKAASPVTPNGFYKGSPLDKALPPKPFLRAHDSPERRGLLDATDSDSSLPNHPALSPESSGGDSPKSFKVAESLGSTPSTLAGEIEIGTGLIFQSKVISSITVMDLEKAKAVNAIPIRTADKDGSPIQRVQGLSSMPSNSSLNRRHARVGVGLTIRKSADAHELIMGTPEPEASPYPPRTSSLPKGVKSTGQLSTASRLSRPTAASAARAAESKKSMLTPGKSLLSRDSASKVSILSSSVNKSVDTPLNKAASNIGAGSLPKSSTVSSMKKGFKNRISEIFSGRRRTTVSSSSAENKGYATIDDEEEDIILECDFESVQSTPITNKRAHRASKLLTTYHNSDMDAKASPTENIRGGKKTPFMGKMSDREQSSREQRRFARDERRVNRISERLAGGIGQQGAARSAGHIGRGDEPPSPPPTRHGPAGHYDEGEVVEENGNAMTEEEFDYYLEVQLQSAEEHLNEVIAGTNVGSADAATRERVENVIRALGESIIAARSAHIAGIQLRVATANLIQSTTQRSAGARQAIAAAITAQGN